MVNQLNVEKNYNELLNFVKRENLLVVSKGEAFDKIDPLLKLGHRYFAENRIFEAKEKWQDITIAYPDLKLFYIGPLQTNKLKQYLSFFDHISSLYRKKEVDQIVKYLDLNREISFSIQINISREPQKSGLLIEEFDAFYLYAKERGLTINSIMAIPMKNASTKDNMKELIGIKSKYDLSYISYGMSDDYLDALKYGSDQVRIGSKIFGKMT